MSVHPIAPESRLLPPLPAAAVPPHRRRRVRDGLHRLRRPRHAWPRVLRSGLLLWAVAVLATQVTGNPTIVPAVILFGSALVPVTCVVAAWEHRRNYAGNRADTVLVLRCALLGGMYAAATAAIAERLLLRPGVALYPDVGMIEETAKLVALLWCTRTMGYRTVRDGMVLGASVGFGFAAVESAGYAFNALFTPAGLSFGSLVDTEALRAATAPFGHGLWTAVLGAAWFAAFPQPLRQRLRRRLRPAHAVLVWAPGTLVVPPARRRWRAPAVAALTWLYVSSLHAAFDAVPGLLTDMFRGRTGGVALLLSDLAAVAVITFAGLAALYLVRRRARQQDLPDLLFSGRLTDTTVGRHLVERISS